MVVKGLEERAGAVLIRGMYMTIPVKGINKVRRKGGRRKTAFEDRQGGAGGCERLAKFCNGATLGGGGQWASC